MLLHKEEYVRKIAKAKPNQRLNAKMLLRAVNSGSITPQHARDFLRRSEVVKLYGTNNVITLDKNTGTNDCLLPFLDPDKHITANICRPKCIETIVDKIEDGKLLPFTVVMLDYVWMQQGYDGIFNRYFFGIVIPKFKSILSTEGRIILPVQTAVLRGLKEHKLNEHYNLHYVVEDKLDDSIPLWWATNNIHPKVLEQFEKESKQEDKYSKVEELDGREVIRLGSELGLGNSFAKDWLDARFIVLLKKEEEKKP